MERVLNTPFLIVKKPDDKKYYLYAGRFWYVSGGITSGWSKSTALPARIKTLDTEIKKQEIENQEEEATPAEPATPTTILVSTKPAELIQTKGEATFVSIEGTGLLLVNNSEEDIFKNNCNDVSTRDVNRGPSVSNTGRGTSAATRDNTSGRPFAGGNTKQNTGNVSNKSTTPRSTSKVPNNVYSDKSGNVYKQGSSGDWQQRNNGSWQSSSSGRQSSTSNMDKSSQMRDRSTMRTNHSMQSRPSSGGYSGGGGYSGRSGGGRR